jgi:signal transduction histidine kinase
VKPSLRTELLLNLAILAATALALGVASVITLNEILPPARTVLVTVALIAADVGIFLGFVAFQVDRVVLRPLRNAMAATEAIAAGDTARRLDAGSSAEMANLADSVNRMTDRLLEERGHVVRAEKLASIGRLASGIAHEIGNPLGAINGYAHILRTATPGSEHATQAIEGLEHESARIDRIVRSLLDYARAKPRTSGDIDLVDTINAMLDLVSGQGQLRHIRLDVSAPDEVLCIPGERHDVEQALINLVLNAVDAMEGQGILRVIIRRAARAELAAGTHRASDSGAPVAAAPPPLVRQWLARGQTRDVVTVAIVDSGPGVPDSDMERIFEPFYTTKEPGKGTGLGLAIAARAVENCGGVIWASPSREGGAAFRILFPLTRIGPQVTVTPQPLLAQPTQPTLT